MIDTFAPGVVPAVLTAVAAALVLAWAWHGRQVDEHPMCRRCGFSLLGRTKLMLPECPECGSDLGRRGAVRVGRRRRRRPVIALSLLVIALSTAWVAISSTSQAQGFDWAAHKPLAWVLSDASGTDPRSRDAALSELARRVRDGELSPAKEEALVEQALALQADLSRPWSAGWGEIVEAAQALGRLDASDWARYQAQSVTFAVGAAHERVHDLADLRLRLVRGPDRTSGRPKFRVELAAYVEPQLTVAGQVLPADVDPADAAVRSVAELDVPPHESAELLAVLPVPGAATRGGATHLAGVGTDPAPDRLAPGPQTARLSVLVRPLRPAPGSVNGKAAYALEAEQRRVELTAKWELLPTGTLDEYASPEFKGVWVPPSHREKILKESARRREAQGRAREELRREGQRPRRPNP